MIKWFMRLRQHYRDLRLQTKFTITHLVITTLPILLLALFFYGRLYNMVTADTIRTEQTASSKTTPMIEELIDRVLSTHAALRALSFYETVLEGESVAGDADQTPDTMEFYREAQDLIDGELITDIRVYIDLPETQALFSVPGASHFFRPMKEAKGAYWHGIFKSGRSYTSLYCPSFYLSPDEAKKYGPLAYITKSSVFYDGESRDCFTAVYYSDQLFTELLSNNLVADGSVAYLINDRNSLITTSDEALAGIYHFDYETIRNSFMSSNNFVQKNVLGQDVYTGFYNIRKAEWFMVVVIPSEPVVAKSIWIMVEIFLLYLGCVIVAFLIATRLSNSITHRISTVIEQMAQVRSHPPVALPAPLSHDEIGNLIDTYNYMTMVMNQLTEEQTKAAEDLRIAEFSSLQAQINPHFLYNTMDMINWLAKQGRNQEVCDAVQDLSRFYKLTLSRKETLTTIAEEIEHVSIYVRLQNMRFNNGIDFVVDIPDYLMDYRIPKLTFQPVVENSILHGIREKDSKTGAIVLTGWLEENKVVILISDDGVGIPAGKVARILSGESSGGKGSNIAVFNTHRRLQLLYGADYGLTYHSEAGKGTDVELRLPAETGEKSLEIDHHGIPAAKFYLPLVTVSRQKSPLESLDIVSPLTLLRYNRKLTTNTYEIHNLHQISDRLSKGEEIYLLSHRVTEDFPAHTHGYYEINYVCQGAVINVVDSHELYVAAGDLVILNQQAVHAIKYCQPDTLLLNFCLHQPLLDHTLHSFCQSQNPLADFLRGSQKGKPNYIFYPLGHSLKAQSLISAILREYADADFHQTASLEAMFLLLFDQLAHSEEYSYDGVDEQTLQMVQYIRANCLTQTTPVMASALGLSAQSMESFVKQRLGRKLDDIIREVCLNRGLQLLAQPKLHLYQIAESCGYDDYKRFFDDFENQFGISPEEYRRQLM